MTTGPDPVRVAANAITDWLNSLGIADAITEPVDDARGERVYEVTSKNAPHRWPLQVGPAQLRGELQWPAGVELQVIGGHGCRVREGDAVLPWPYDNDSNEAWWEELCQPPRPIWPR